MPVAKNWLGVLCALFSVGLACQAPPDNQNPPSSGCSDGGVSDANSQGQQLACDGGCIDPLTDSQHCGGCDKPCPQGCSAGMCAPPTLVAMGERHTCAVLANGRMRCWGANDHGQLGDGTRAAQARPVVAVPTLTGVQSVAAGAAHTCAMDAENIVWCWGANDRGQLGTGDRQERLMPGVALTTQNVQLAVGSQFACSLHQSGQVECWGANEHGQLGDGSNNDRAAPVSVLELDNVVRIAAGRDGACALRRDGGVWCWGSLGTSQQGNGPSNRAQARFTLQGIEDLAVGDGHVCVRMGTGSVLCQGSNRYGELGTGSLQTPPNASVMGLSDARAIYAAGRHTCALSASRGALCWGKNSEAQLGDGTFVDRSAPASVLLLANARSIATGPSHGCGIVGTDILCWGMGTDGQLGDGTNQGHSTPTLVRW